LSALHTLPATVDTVHRGFFAAALSPVLTIASGDIVEVTTLSGSLEDLPDPRSGLTILEEHKALLDNTAPGEGPHFMTGPIEIEGAQPGDEVNVEILSVALAQDWGWNLIAPQKGTLPQLFPCARRIHVSIDCGRGTVTLPWGLQLRAVPFFGIIGVAPPPAIGRVTSIIPREFGGNIDNRHLGAGATLHLPVFNAGALLSVGDGHALQGDGEVCLTAIETALIGTFRVTLTKATGIAKPWAETPSHLITMAFDPNLELAAQAAIRDMIELIERRTGLTAADAYTLCSIGANVHVTQLVNVHKGVHVMLPKEALLR
jgi:acetamidase/formamidase